MAITAIQKTPKFGSQKRKERVGLVVCYGFTALLIAVLVFPFIYMALASFQSGNDAIFALPPRMFPKSWHFANYRTAFAEMHFMRALGNTLLIMGSVMVLNMTGSLLAAYGFARFRARGKDILFWVLLSTMMLPWVVTMIPAFALFKYIGWVGTRLPLIVPAIGGSAYNIFMLRQFIMNIPRDLDEAAKIDGCSTPGILFKILLPNMKPVLATLFIFLFQGMWSNYIGPSIYLMKEEQWTLALALNAMKTPFQMQWHWTMAGSVMFALPIIIVLFAAQNFFTRGIVVSSFK
jgi:ABC-type glycerol-3-phosphate transport system permease component